MSTNTYDFNALLQDAKAGAAWPKGEYDFEVVEATAKTASTGSPMVVTKLRCISGEKVGKSVTNNFVLTVDNPSALNIFFRHMAAFGLDNSFFAQIGSGTLDPVASALVGRRARIEIDHRDWNGTKQNSVKAVKALTGGPAAGGPGVPGPSVGVPTPGVPTPGTMPGMPTPGVPITAPAPVPTPTPVPQPVAQPVAQPAPIAPVPQPQPQVATPAPAPAPVTAAPQPQATPAPGQPNGAAGLPPGVDAAQYQAFLAFQAQQAQATQAPAQQPAPPADNEGGSALPPPPQLPV